MKEWNHKKKESGMAIAQSTFCDRKFERESGLTCTVSIRDAPKSWLPPYRPWNGQAACYNLNLLSVSLTPAATGNRVLPRPSESSKNSSSVLGTTQSPVSLWVQIPLWAWGLSWPLSLNCNQLSSNILSPLQLHYLTITSYNIYSFFFTKWFLSCHILEFLFKAGPMLKD